jgi:hypothetical protein
MMLRLATRALVHGRRRAALAAAHPKAYALRSLALFSTSSDADGEKPQVELPSHIKFRMPDLDFNVRCCIWRCWQFVAECYD